MKWLVHLPRRAMLRGVDVHVLARRAGDVRNERELAHRFDLHSHEHKIVAELLRASPQLWIFRCDQLRACGDIAVVDMSAPRVLRACVVLELKQRARLVVAPKHRQLANHGAVVAELTERGILAPKAASIACVGFGEHTPLPRPVMSGVGSRSAALR